MNIYILIILLFVIVLFILFIVFTHIAREQDDRAYQDKLDELYKQLQTGKITLGQYHELRMDLEVRYGRTQRDRGVV